MSISILRIIIALILIAHGVVHFILTLVPIAEPGAKRTPFWPSWRRDATDPAWLASRLGLPAHWVRRIGYVLWVAALIGFVLAGLGLIGLPGLNLIWTITASFGAVASLILLLFYWHPSLFTAVIFNLAVLASVAFLWPNLFY